MSNYNDSSLTVAEAKVIEDPRIREMYDRLKLMITNGRKLSDAQAAALAQFAAQENLDPFNQECWYIDGVGPAIGIKGLRRKAQENLESEDPKNGHYFDVKFIDVTSEYLIDEPNLGYAFRAVLRDSRTSSKYLAMMAEYKAKGLTKEEIIGVIGNPPTWDGVGFWLKTEKNPNKDRLYRQDERAKKRAEALAIKKRFNLNYDNVVEIINSGNHIETLSDMETSAIIEAPAKSASGLRSPEEVRFEILGNAEDMRAKDIQKPVSQGDKGIVLSCLAGITAPGDTNMHRHIILKYIFGVTSSKDLDDAQWRGLGKYLDIEKISTGEYMPKDPQKTREISNLLAFATASADQEALPINY